MYAVGVVCTDVQVFVVRASFERTYQRFLHMAELSPVLSLVLGYWKSLVMGPVYNRDHQGFQKTWSFMVVKSDVDVLTSPG